VVAVSCSRGGPRPTPGVDGVAAEAGAVRAGAEGDTADHDATEHDATDRMGPRPVSGPA
jgi:hypothetical protein